MKNLKRISYLYSCLFRICILFIINILMMQANYVKSQDIHVSQYLANPLNMNPALAGGFNGDIRGIATYKGQWDALKAYKTSIVSCDGSLHRHGINYGYLSGGLSLFYDLADSARLSTTQANLSLAYHLKFNKQNLFSVGMQGGIIQQQLVDPNFEWGSQYDGKNYNSALVSGEHFTRNGYLVPDVSLGGTWNYTKQESKDKTSKKSFNSEIGLAIFHVNRPEYSYFTNFKVKMEQRYLMHGRSHIGINSLVALIPSFIIMRQGNASETIIGTGVSFIPKKISFGEQFTSERAFTVGMLYRFEDAFIASFLFELKHLTIGFSYDINISDLKSVTKYNGGAEITIGYKATISSD